jgi:hypothetical protein
LKRDLSVIGFPLACCTELTKWVSLSLKSVERQGFQEREYDDDDAEGWGLLAGWRPHHSTASSVFILGISKLQSTAATRLALRARVQHTDTLKDMLNVLYPWS